MENEKIIEKKGKGRPRKIIPEIIEPIILTTDLH